MSAEDDRLYFVADVARSYGESVKPSDVQTDGGIARSAANHRLDGRVAIVTGAGQTPGATVGNGRATAMLYAREGATVVVVDVDLPAALDTVTEIESSGGNAIALNVDVTDEGAVEELVRRCHADFGSIDILHNNVGASLSLGDGPVTEITSDAFDRVIAVNLKSMILTAKHAVPLMREQRRGVIINISSFAAYGNYPNIAYKTAKAGVIALTQNLAITNAEFNIRANSVVPGLINTPMAVESRIGRLGSSREEVIARRDEQVPLGHKMGSAWDVAYASLFLASDEARFITGVALPVDGGQSLKIG